MISRSEEANLSTESKAKLQEFWRYYLYLIIDEMSMIGKTFLAKLSRNIAIGKMVEGKLPSPHSFGGISVIKCGDFFQFPPVASGLTEAFYFPINLAREQTLAQLGRAIYEEFTTVVVLKE
jgi:hypothetical protein